jgi:hypothetical protein
MTKCKQRKRGSAEIVAVLYIPVFMLMILGFILFLKANRYDYFVESVKSDLQSRMKIQCQIYKYENFVEVQTAFEELKKEYAADFKKLYNNKALSKKIANQIIEGITIEEMVFEDTGTNERDGFYFYRVNVKDIEVDMIWFKYKPNKPGYVIFPKEEEL